MDTAIMGTSQRQVYLDVCALNRPFDDQSQIRIRMESDAVHLILEHVRGGTISMAVSSVHFLEIAANPDLAEQQHVEYLCVSFGEMLSVDAATTRKRVQELFLAGWESLTPPMSLLPKPPRAIL